MASLHCSRVGIVFLGMWREGVSATRLLPLNNEIVVTLFRYSVVRFAESLSRHPAHSPRKRRPHSLAAISMAISGGARFDLEHSAALLG